MENIKYKGHTINISQDEYTEDPRKQMDFLGTMYCFHRRYSLGDEHSLSIEEVKEISRSEKYISLPLYLYDHGGITMSTAPFSCPWDSGQVGIIAVEKSKVRKEFDVKKISSKLRDKVIEMLKNEVSLYDQYLRGDVYCIAITDPHGETLECFDEVYDNISDPNCETLKEMRSIIDYSIEHSVDADSTMFRTPALA